MRKMILASMVLCSLSAFADPTDHAQKVMDCSKAINDALTPQYQPTPALIEAAKTDPDAAQRLGKIRGAYAVAQEATARACDVIVDIRDVKAPNGEDQGGTHDRGASNQ